MPNFWEEINVEMERIGPTSLAAHIDPTRPYDGQPHTDYGDRGKTKIDGLTFRDLRDCFMKACCLSSGKEPKDWPGSVHDLPWDEMDIVAVAQNLSCEIEKFMGIYPNVPRLYPVDPTEPHWCGWPLSDADYQRHQGTCDDPTEIIKEDT